MKKKRRGNGIAATIIDSPRQTKEYMRRYMLVYRAMRDGPKTDLEKEIVSLLRRTQLLVKQL